MSTQEEKSENEVPELLTQCVDVGDGKRVCITVKVEEVAFCAGCPDCPAEKREHHPQCSWGKTQSNTVTLRSPNKERLEYHLVQCPPSSPAEQNQSKTAVELKNEDPSSGNNFQTNLND